MIKMIKWIANLARTVVQRYQYVLIVPEYKGVHYCWTMDEIVEWIQCYNPGFTERVEYVVYSPYMTEPIMGLKMNGDVFINGL